MKQNQTPPRSTKLSPQKICFYRWSISTQCYAAPYSTSKGFLHFSFWLSIFKVCCSHRFYFPTSVLISNILIKYNSVITNLMLVPTYTVVFHSTAPTPSLLATYVKRRHFLFLLTFVFLLPAFIPQSASIAFLSSILYFDWKSKHRKQILHGAKPSLPPPSSWSYSGDAEYYQ